MGRILGTAHDRFNFQALPETPAAHYLKMASCPIVTCYAQNNFEMGITGYCLSLPQNNEHNRHASYFLPITQYNCIQGFKKCPLPVISSMTFVRNARCPLK